MYRSNYLQLFVSLVALVTVTLLWVVPVQAQFNEQINYQGRLLDSTGSAVTDGTYAMEFNLYTVATSGSAIWTETLSGVNEVTVTDGLFSVMLGSTSALTSVDFNQTLYLGVTIEADSEMAPRKILGAVPAAFVAKEAGNASTVGGVASTSLVRNDAAGTTTASSTATILSVVQNGLGKIASFFSGVTEVFTILNNGNVGIGTTTPSSRLAVAGNAVIGGDLTATGTLSVGTLDGLLLGTNGVVSAVATSTLGLGNGTFLGLADTPSSYTANRIMFTNSGATALTDSASLTFDGSLLSVTGSTTASDGYYIGSTAVITGSTTKKNFFFAGAIGTTSTSTGISNYAIGENAMYTNTSGSFNTAIGKEALYTNISGFYNNAIGAYVMKDNTTGNYNNAMGQNALTSNTSGSDNVAVGDWALGSNVAGDRNTALGSNALSWNNGTGSIAIGYDAGKFAESVDRGIFIGYNISAASTTQDDVLNIGNLIFGNNVDGTGTTLSSGNIGIGTSSPSSKLTVAGAGYFGGNLTATGTLTISGTSTLATTTITDFTVARALRDTTASAGTLGQVLQSTGTSTRWVSTSTLGISGGASALASLSDVSLGGLASGQLLSYNGSAWNNVATSTLGLGNGTFLGLSDTPSSYTANRIMFTNSGATALTDSANFLFDGSQLATLNLAVTGTSTFTGTSTMATTTFAGNVGVGTTTSLSRLTVQGFAGQNDILTVASSTGNPSLRVLADNNVELTGQLIDAGVSWTARSAAGNNDTWSEVAYGNGLFVATGVLSGDRVMTSPDGVNWTARSAAGNNDSWYSVTFGNGLFVAVGNGASTDRVMTSPDGITWTVRSASGNNDSWSNITYGNGLFVAVGSGPDRVMTSPDGINWTARSAAGDDDSWQGMTYDNGLFVAVGGGTDTVMYSSNGISWATTTAAGGDDSWRSVKYGNGLFVAVGDSGSDRVMTSPDGITWTARSAAGNDDTWQGITYGNGLFVSVSNLGPDRVMTSPDGINWTARSAAGDDGALQNIVYANGLFVVVGSSNDFVLTSGFLIESRLAHNNIYQGPTTFMNTLTVGTSTNSAALTLQGPAGSTNLLSIASSTGSNLLTLTGAGNLGLGSSSPSSLLTVAGTMTVTGTSTLATTTITNLTLAQALGATSGGTGLSSYATGDLIYASGANTLANRTIGSTGNVLSVVGGVPTWVATSTLGITGATTFLALTDTPSSYTANRIMFTNSGATALTDSASLTFDGTRLSVPNLIVTSTSTFTGTSTFTTGALATYFGSAAADIADAGVLRLGNNELIAWEASPAGTDVSLSVNASEQMLFQGATSSGYVFDNGISLGSALASATTSLDRHLSLWGSVYGFSVTVNSLNYNVAGVGAHNFYRGGTLNMSLTGGSLGIGTANPQQRLDVGNGLITGGTNSGTLRNTLNLSGSASIPAVDFTFPGSGYFRVAEVGVLGTNDVFFQALPATTAGYGYLEAWDSAGMVLGTGNNTAPVIFRPNRTERMRVTAGGNVGIGTTSPLTRLELAGSGTLDQVLRLSNTDTTLSSAQQIGGVEFVSTDANDTAGVVAKVAAYSLGTTGSFGNLGFYTGSISSQLSEKMTILANGNVGIGSTSPSSLLTVAGTTTLATTTVTDVTLSGAFRDVTSSAGTLGQVLQSTGTSTRWVATSTLGISGGGTFLSLTDTPSSFTANRIMFTNSGATALTDSASLTFDGSQLATLNLAVTGTSTFTGTTTMASTSISGTLQMGTTSVSSRFNLDVNNFSAAGTAGLNRFYTSTNAASGTVQFGELGYFKNSASATTTIVSSLFRVEDSTTFGNTVRGLEVQANRGTNTQGENTALSGFARTFGVRGFSSGDAGARFEPAGGYFETGGTTQGNAIRGYSSSITSANLLALFQDTSTFSGTGLNIDLGNGTGSFTGKFLDLKVAGASRFNVASTGTLVTQGDISIVTTNTDPAANNVVGMYFGANGFASINRTGNVAMNLGRSNDGAVLQFYSAGAVQGSVSIAGATVSYNAFTGSHFGLVGTTTYEKGTLLELTGENAYYNDDATSEIIYGMQKSTTENSSKVIGSYLATLEPSQTESTANPTLVMAVGNGHMWVADQGEDIKAGDYLISSNVPGHAEKDNGTSSMSYIIARASEDIDWNNVNTEIDGVKHKLVTVFFENFTRPNVDFALVASSTIGLADVPEDSFTDSFLTGLFAKVAQWVGDAQNGIGSMYANVFNAGERICVDGECLTADDIRDLKNALQGGGSSNPPSSPGGDGGGGSTEGDTGGGETVDDGSAAGGEAGTGGDGVADGNTGATDGTTDGGAGTSSGDSGGTDSGGADVGSSDGGA